MLDAWRRRLARLIAPTPAKRSYAAARNSRLSSFGSLSNSSADSELSMSLTALRTRSRKLVRDASYAKRARTIIVNNVVGSGVNLQSQVMNTRGELHARLNAEIERAWREWCKAPSCHTGGRLHFADMQRMLLGQVFEAGEVFPRLHRRAFGGSKVPLSVEVVEAERIADEFSHPQPAPASSAEVRMGIEVDSFGRPVAYWMRERHPGELRMRIDATVQLERIQASEVLHLHVVDRWPQTRGEPWLHTVIRKLDDMDEYSSAELTAARLSACLFGTIESDGGDPNPLGASSDLDGSRQLNMEPGVIEALSPGEKLNLHAPNRPNQALDPFLRYMLREVAAGLGVSYESLSRDYSQSNYSSSRLALLDDRDLWQTLQQWFARSFLQPLFEQWLQAAVLAGAITGLTVEQYALAPERFNAPVWKFRGWSWVDPTKEVNAYKEAVKAGFTSVTRVIALTANGADIEDILTERKRELALFEEAGVEVDTTVEEPVAPVAPAPADDEQPNDDGEAQPARVVNLRTR